MPKRRKSALVCGQWVKKPAAPMWKPTSILPRVPRPPPRWATSSTGSVPATIRTRPAGLDEIKGRPKTGRPFGFLNLFTFDLQVDIDLSAAIKSAQRLCITSAAFVLRIDFIIDIRRKPGKSKSTVRFADVGLDG